MASLRPKLTIDLGLSKMGLDKGLADARGELEHLGNTADKTAGKLSRLKGSFGKALGGIATTAGGFLAASVIQKGFSFVKSQIGGVISAASDMNETVSKTEAVFGSNADAVKKWGDTAASTVGLSKQAALEGASTVGNLLKGVGVANDELPKMSTNLIQAAADLGSFNNVDPAAALEDLRSGLVGQSEPLRKYGILINEAAVNAKAMQMGLADANGELSEGAKVQARYALIMEQLGDAQGDFAKTSGGLANGTRILQANIQNLKARIGAGLVPVLARAVAGTNKLFGLFDEFHAKGYSNFNSAARVVQSVIAKYFGANAGKSVFASIMKVRDAVLSFVAVLKRNREGIAAFAKTLARVWFTGAQIVFQILRLLVRVAEWAWSKIEAPVRRFVAFLRGLDFKHGALGDLIDIFQAIAKGDWASAWGEIKNFLSELWQLLVNLPWGAIFSKALELMIAGVTAVGSWLIGTAIPFLVDAGVKLIGALIDAIWSEKTKQILFAVGRNILSFLWWGISSVWNWLLGQISNLPGAMIGAITWSFNWFYSIGQWLLHGLASGVLSVAADLANAVINAVSGAIQAGKNALGINSPSKVFMAMGLSVGEGMVKGIGKAETAVQGAIGGMMAAAENGVRVSATVSGSAMLPSVATAGAGTVNNRSSTVTIQPGAIVVNGAQDAQAVAKEVLKGIDRVLAGEVR